MTASFPVPSILRVLTSAICATLIAPTYAQAQNLLVDSGFDAAPQTALGNAGPKDLTPWSFATIMNTGGIIQNAHNLVTVDGTGGYNYSNLGPESDASGAVAGTNQYYIDSGTIPMLGWQYVTPSCSGTATATLYVTNREDHGLNGPTMIGNGAPTPADPSQFFATEGGLAVFPVSSQVPPFPAGFAVETGPNAQLVTALKAQFDNEELRFVLGAGPTQAYPWTPISTQVPVTAGQVYAYMVELGHSVNMDNASLEIACEDPVPQKDPVDFGLKKGCRAMGVENGTAHYLCSIYVSPPSSGTLASPLTLDELFTTVSGAPATTYIQALQGTPAAPNGWLCQQPAFANGASCTISAADFNGNTNHRIDAQISIPTAALVKEGFKNCAQVRIGDKVVGSSECIDIERDVEPTFDIEKTCGPSGDRMTFSPTFWVQPYQCTLTVTTNGAPFTGTLWMTENLSFGQNPGAAQIQNLTSADPWVCATPPFAAPGQGTQPNCSIQGSQFPASGTSTLTVDLLMNASMDLFGAQNCASLLLGKEHTNGLEVANDCDVIAAPPAPQTPSLDISKTCAAGVRGSDGIWTVDCEIIVELEGFDPQQPHQIYLRDELQLDGIHTPLTSLMPFPTMGMGSWGPTTGTPAGYNSGSGMSHNYIGSDGSGTITVPYTATFSGSGGRPLSGPQAMNCTWVYITTLNLRAPSGPLGTEKLCVPLNFPLSAVVDSKPVIADPAQPSGPIFGTGEAHPGPIIDHVAPPLTPTPGTGSISVDTDIPVTVVSPAGCGFDTLFVIDRSGSMNTHNRLQLTKQAVLSALHIFEGGGSKSGAIAFSTTAAPIGASSAVLPSQALDAAISNLSALGLTNWQSGFEMANLVVSPLTDKPLVLFITDGLPNRPSPATGPVGNYPITQAVPALNALRAQGSRVVGIAIGGAGVATRLTQFLGHNLVVAGGNVAIDPQSTDVISIPSSDLIIPAFEAIAQAYCPSRGKMTGAQKLSLMTALQAIPKSAGVYMGDDEMPPEPQQESVVQPQITSAITPNLTIVKSQTSACEPNRASQTYDCGFRLSVTNTGTASYLGPLVMTDTGGTPQMHAATALSNNGWRCGPVVRNAMSCTNSAANLAPGASTHIDLRVQVNGLRNGGSYQNCATTGVTEDRRQRVALVQKIMNDRGLNAGPVDGAAGSKTYAALAVLQKQLGLPVGRDFDDALFAALGLPLARAGAQSCVTANLPDMPAPPLQCEPATTVKQGESCACRFDNMERRTATSCQCGGGFTFVRGKGCVVDAVPAPQPVPVPNPDPIHAPDTPDAPALVCDAATTRLRGDQCVCLDPKNAQNVSPTQCRCTNGLPMIGGKCLPVEINPTPKPAPDTGSVPRPTDEAAEADKCKILLNGICIKK